MPISGRRSSYPGNPDNWGEAKVNDVCQTLTAEYWNTIQDATYALERHTLGVLQTGAAGILTHAVSGANRPAILYKTYTLTLTGSPSLTKTARLSGFTAAEKSLFGGTPLATGNHIVIAIRRLPGDSLPRVCYRAVVQAPMNTDTSGDSGWWIGVSRMRTVGGHPDTDPGTYVATVMITSTS